MNTLKPISNTAVKAEGNTHEERNADGTTGIPIGNNAEVEDQEIIYVNPQGETIVFSNRMTVPETDKTFAEYAELLLKDKSKYEKSMGRHVNNVSATLAEYDRYKPNRTNNTVMRNAEKGTLKTIPLANVIADYDNELAILFEMQNQMKQEVQQQGNMQPQQFAWGGRLGEPTHINNTEWSYMNNDLNNKAYMSHPIVNPSANINNLVQPYISLERHPSIDRRILENAIAMERAKTNNGYIPIKHIDISNNDPYRRNLRYNNDRLVQDVNIPRSTNSWKGFNNGNNVSINETDSAYVPNINISLPKVDLYNPNKGYKNNRLVSDIDLIGIDMGNDYNSSTSNSSTRTSLDRTNSTSNQSNVREKLNAINPTPMDHGVTGKDISKILTNPFLPMAKYNSIVNLASNIYDQIPVSDNTVITENRGRVNNNISSGSKSIDLSNIPISAISQGAQALTSMVGNIYNSIKLNQAAGESVPSYRKPSAPRLRTNYSIDSEMNEITNMERGVENFIKSNTSDSQVARQAIQANRNRSNQMKSQLYSRQFNAETQLRNAQSMATYQNNTQGAQMDYNRDMAQYQQRMALYQGQIQNNNNTLMGINQAINRYEQLRLEELGYNIIGLGLSQGVQKDANTLINNYRYIR